MDDDPKICPVCDARWLEGQLYWNTGREACPHDLAGLVCNVLHPNFKCVNPCKGSDSGIQWGHPQDEIDKFYREAVRAGNTDFIDDEGRLRAPLGESVKLKPQSRPAII